MVDRGYHWLMVDPLRAGYTVCMVMCLSACLFWLLDRSTPELLYVPIGPSLAYGSVICHVGICVERVRLSRKADF